MPRSTPWLAYPFLLFPQRVERNLETIRRAGVVETVPNPWQLALGVMRMWHRIVYRPETVGMCQTNPVRDTWRARLLHHRPIRFPFLLAEKAVFPLDLTGLVSSPERMMRHVLGAHHDRDEFIYDLEILECYGDQLAELERRTREIVETDSPRSMWLRDLVVYDGYHERLLDAVHRAVVEGVRVPRAIADDPDFSFRAYLRWCAAQPQTPEETLRELLDGTYDLGRGRPGTDPGVGPDTESPAAEWRATA